MSSAQETTTVPFEPAETAARPFPPIPSTGSAELPERPPLAERFAGWENVFPPSVERATKTSLWTSSAPNSSHATSIAPEASNATAGT